MRTSQERNRDKPPLGCSESAGGENEATGNIKSNAAKCAPLRTAKNELGAIETNGFRWTSVPYVEALEQRFGRRGHRLEYEFLIINPIAFAKKGLWW
jgi:hypothetical protein